MKSVTDRRNELLSRQSFLQGRLSHIELELDGHEAKDFEDFAGSVVEAAKK